MLKRGSVYQMGALIPNVGWEAQPPLIYITRVTGREVEGIVDGKRVTATYSYEWGWRGTVSEKDLKKMEK